MKPFAEIIRCPIHGIPDCSPLLNGCSVPNRLADAYALGHAAAVQEATLAVSALTDPPVPVDGWPQSYVVDRTCRCGGTRLGRRSPRCPSCADHLDLPPVVERNAAPTQ